MGTSHITHVMGVSGHVENDNIGNIAFKGFFDRSFDRDFPEILTKIFKFCPTKTEIYFGQKTDKV